MRSPALLPDTAERVRGTETQTVPISELNVSDVVLVRPGTRVPADGEVVEGSADPLSYTLHAPEPVAA